ncbi:MAG: efflux RND transporter periplasmic adaptor subunit, partial [Gluconacetobacter diazotrophicus]|nr:efflux RND transporter periplasmic adaptor subunit [Gluconacetobacter diazotrophicus]
MAEPTETRPRVAAPRVKGRRRWLPWVILLLVAAAIAFALLRPKQAAPPGRHGRHAAGATGDRPQPVSAARIRTGDMPVVLTELGTVTSLATITVQSQISGYLLEVNFHEGQEVKKGDQLALVDPRLYQATLTQYQGNLVRDQALLRQAQADNARYTLLLQQKSIAAQTAQNQQYVVGQYQGAVLADQGQIANAKQNLAYCRIASPIDGRVGLRQVDAGNYITSGETNGLVVVTQIHPISVIFSIPQADIPDVQGQLAAGSTLRVDAFDSSNTSKLATGKVETLDNTIDTSTGTVRIRSTFGNDDERLFPNQFVNARLLLKTLHDVALIPNNAIQTGPDGAFAYVVKPDSTVEVRPIKTGTADGTDTVVTTGLK